MKSGPDYVVDWTQFIITSNNYFDYNAFHHEKEVFQIR